MGNAQGSGQHLLLLKSPLFLEYERQVRDTLFKGEIDCKASCFPLPCTKRHADAPQFPMKRSVGCWSTLSPPHKP